MVTAISMSGHLAITARRGLSILVSMTCPNRRPKDFTRWPGTAKAFSLRPGWIIGTELRKYGRQSRTTTGRPGLPMLQFTNHRMVMSVNAAILVLLWTLRDASPLCFATG